MIKVYGDILSRAGIVMFTLELLGQPYEVIELAPGSEATQQPDYLALNPTAKVPTIQDKELTLWETQAILFYLAANYGDNLLWSDTPAKVADIQRWSLFISNQLEAAALDMLIHVEESDGQPDPAFLNKTGQVLQHFLSVLESHLQSREYLAEDKLTVADIHGASVLDWSRQAGFDMQPYPGVDRWISHILAHPAQQRLMHQA